MTLDKITHVIFDFDGVLIDSEQVYSNVNQAMLSKYGKTFTLEMKLAMMGTKKSEAVAILLKSAGIEHLLTPEQYLESYDVLLDQSLTECPELPAASKLINHFYDCKIPLAICTGSDAHEFETKATKLYKHWLEKIPLQVLCGDDPEVTHGKPSPIPYQITMKRMPNPPTDPKNVLVFEDSLNGAKSAIAAGTRCVMIPQRQFLNDAGLAEIELIRPQLDEVLESLEQFDPTKYGIPPF